MPAAPVHHTAVDKDGAWDGPAAEKAFTGTSQADFDKLFAWVEDPGDDGLTKSDGWGPHHDVGSDGDPGSANLKGVQAAMAALNGAHGGTSVIPEDTRQKVWDHLAAHYKDAGVEEGDIPELKALRAAGDQCNRCTGTGTITLDGTTVTCPQCGGTGTGSGNATSAPRPPAAAIRGDLRGVPESRVSSRREFELREVPDGTGGTNLRFTGFASVTTPGDGSGEYEMEDWMGPWTESVSVGSFAKTLAEGCDTAFLLNHTGMTLARTKPGTLKLSEETEGAKSPIYGVTGLHSQATLDPSNIYVQAMRSAVERQDLDEMSFAFRVMRQEWNEDYTRRWINEVSMDKGDVSLVNYGANPITGGTVSMRQRLAARAGSVDVGRLAAMIQRSVVFRVLKETREGKVLSAANAEQLQTALEALHTADDADIPGIVRALQGIDTALDAGMAAVSGVLQTADPDGDPNDLEPALVPPGTQTNGLLIPDSRADRARLERLRRGGARKVPA